jgi:hypothetical protein
LTHAIRAGRSTDVPFVVKSWLRSYNQEHIRPEERRCGYWTAHKEVVGDLLMSSTLLVCHDPEKPPERDLRGFAVGEARPDALVLHYVYTRDGERRKGVARSLVEALRQKTSASTVIVTHVTTRDVARYCHTREWSIAPLAALYRTITRMRHELAAARGEPR